MSEHLEKLKRQRLALEKAIAEEEAKQSAIGSLDWAIQRMREGEKIFRPDWADKTARISMVVDDKITWESDALGITIMDMRKWDSRILGEYRNSGWQIYEPKPHYQVGDWVEWSESLGETYQSKITRVSNSAVYSNGLCLPLNIITRKLKPSEVVLDFGNGIKGTIEKEPDDTNFIVVWKMFGRINKEIANISIATLTEPMRTTVLELLRAQGEEEK